MAHDAAELGSVGRALVGDDHLDLAGILAVGHVDACGGEADDAAHMVGALGGGEQVDAVLAPVDDGSLIGLADDAADVVGAGAGFGAVGDGAGGLEVLDGTGQDPEEAHVLRHGVAFGDGLVSGDVEGDGVALAVQRTDEFGDHLLDGDVGLEGHDFACLIGLGCEFGEVSRGCDGGDLLLGLRFGLGIRGAVRLAGLGDLDVDVLCGTYESDGGVPCGLGLVGGGVKHHVAVAVAGIGAHAEPVGCTFDGPVGVGGHDDGDSAAGSLEAGFRLVQRHLGSHLGLLVASGKCEDGRCNDE